MGSKLVDKFPTTDWALVRDAAGMIHGGNGNSLDRLVGLYEPVIRRYLLCQKRLAPDHVDDLVQGFIADKLLEQHLIQRADQRRGRFRNLLVRALEHYLIDCNRRRLAACRSPAGAEVQSLGSEIDVAAPNGSDPSRAFDRTWAETVVQAALDMTRRRCEERHRLKQWQVFSFRVLEHHQDGTPSYSEVIRRFGFENPIEASNALITCKRMFERNLRRALARYGPLDDASFNEELRQLWEILSGNRAES